MRAGDRHVGVELAELGRRDREVLGNGTAAGEIDLVDHEDLRRLDLLHEVGDEAVASPDRARRLDEHAHHVDLRERGTGALVGALAEQRARLVDARRVEQHDLVVGSGAHTADLVARRLRPVGDDRHLRADDPVHEGGLADVGSADERDEPGAERHEDDAPATGWSLASAAAAAPATFGTRVISTDTIRFPSTCSVRSSRFSKRTVSPSAGT